MKYFIDSEKGKVSLALVSPAITDETLAHCWDIDGNEYMIPKSDILEDGEDPFVEVSIPIEFPKGFVPLEKFHEDHCMWCPFYFVEEEIGCYCSHKDYNKESTCPIRKHFVG